MNDQQIIEYLRSRGRAEPPLELTRSVMAAIDEAPPARSWFSAQLPALAAAGAVAVLAAVVILLGQNPNVGPGPSPSAEASATAASVEELEAAVSAATERLAEAPGVEGVHTSMIEEYLGSAGWFDWRPNGDQVVVLRRDVDVMTPWWMDPDGEPLTVGERVETNITALVGDRFYRTEDGAWVVSDRADAPRGPLSYATGLLSGEMPAVPPPTLDAEPIVTRRDDAGGGEIWTLEISQDEGTTTLEWLIGPDGTLASIASEGVDVTLAPTENLGTGSTRFTIEFTAHDDPEPIPTPDVDAPPDPAAFGLPPDFPLPGP